MAETKSEVAPRPPQPRPMARQPRKLTSILRVVMIAALLPFRLSDLPAVLPSIMQRLDADTPASMPAQLNDFRASLQSHQLN